MHLTMLRKIRKELERRVQEEAMSHLKWKHGQQAFLDNQARIRLLCGANGVGKSSVLVADGISEALGYEPWSGKQRRTPPTRILFCVEDFLHAADDDLGLILDMWLPASRVVRVDILPNGKRHRWHLDNGSIIKLMTYNQASMGFEGVTWDFVGFNEPPPKAVYNGCLRGIAKRDGRMSFAMTPLGPNAAWICDSLISEADGKDVSVFEIDIEESYMDPESKRLFIDRCDPEEADARLHGKFKSLLGRIYRQFTEEHILHGEDTERIKDLAKDPKIPVGLVVDPHDRRPFFAAWFLIDTKGRMIFFKEWPNTVFRHERTSDLDIEGYAKLFTQIEKDAELGSIWWRLMDPNFGRQRRVLALENISDSFVRFGLNFRTDIDDDIASGHLAVRSRLLDKTLLFTDDCPNICHSMRSYCWHDRRRDQVLRERPSEYAKDPADAVRYACVSCHGYVSPVDIISEIEELNAEVR